MSALAQLLIFFNLMFPQPNKPKDTKSDDQPK